VISLKMGPIKPGADPQTASANRNTTNKEALAPVFRVLANDSRVIALTVLD
jgi:hypothetical protein